MSSYSNNKLFTIETTLPQIETTLPQIETTLPQIETTLPQIETTQQQEPCPELVCLRCKKCKKCNNNHIIGIFNFVLMIILIGLYYRSSFIDINNKHLYVILAYIFIGYLYVIFCIVLLTQNNNDPNNGEKWY